MENFRDKCGGVPRWLDQETSYVAFQEGWALYAENPLLSDDTDLYDDDLLQTYGMVKWQVCSVPTGRKTISSKLTPSLRRERAKIQTRVGEG